MEPSRAILGPLWRMLGPFKNAFWGLLGTILAYLWAILDHAGSILGYFGKILGYLRFILNHLGATLKTKPVGIGPSKITSGARPAALDHFGVPKQTLKTAHK